MRSAGTPTTSRQMASASSSLDVHGDPQAVGVETQGLGDELPRVGNGLLFEVVAEAEVAQHLEERQVARRVADLVEVVVLAAGAHAFLHRDRPRPRRDLFAQEVGLERHHARDGEQQRRVVRDETRRSLLVMLSADEEIDESAAQLVRVHDRRL